MTDRCLGDPESSSELTLRLVNCRLDLADVIGRQLGSSYPLPGITHIVRRHADVEVFGIDARLHVAMMQHLLALDGIPAVDLSHHLSMRQHRPSIDPGHAVPVAALP